VRIAEDQARTEGTRAELLRERAALIERSFRAGESALPELLRASTASAQADVAFAGQRAALGLARARLNQVNGLMP
jgi:outer membrane protein TolC